MKRRLLCLLLACFMLFAAACGDGGEVASLLLEEMAEEDSPVSSPAPESEERTKKESPVSSLAPIGGEETEGFAIVPDECSVEENSHLLREGPVEDGVYTSKEDVALYLHLYGHLPHNFMTKEEARELGWEGGSLEPYAPDMCIGGDRFGNYEGLLPEAAGRNYYECDIDTLGADKRGAKRIVYSNDGLIYYTDDHYESFTLLYGREE